MKPLFRVFWEIGVVLFVAAESLKAAQAWLGAAVWQQVAAGAIYAALILILASWAVNLYFQWPSLTRPIRIAYANLFLDTFEARRAVLHPEEMKPLSLRLEVCFSNGGQEGSFQVLPYVEIELADPDKLPELRRFMGISDFRRFWLTESKKFIKVEQGNSIEFDVRLPMPLRDVPTQEVVDLLEAVNNDLEEGRFRIIWWTVEGWGWKRTFRPRQPKQKIKPRRSKHRS